MTPSPPSRGRWRRRPDGRPAFVPQDVFAVPHGETGTILGKSADATKTLTSRVLTSAAPKNACGPSA
ncbi:hypothetical protein ACFVXC_37745 [Streptomyces sp. NPDC058257]|uniref:hypothetical protein n=1 Tax=Streptomyces sp. NPDC058257 TaxID=3346409 RepID=UPI0036E317BE